MPIKFAAYSIWQKGKISIPSDEQSWSILYDCPIENFSSVQNSNWDAATDIVNGSALNRIWNIGHTTWNVEITIPLIVDNYGQTMNTVTFMNAFLNRALYPHRVEGNAFGSDLKYKIENDIDFLIKNISINIGETSNFKVTLLCTTDPRNYFYTQTGTITNTQNRVYRTISPYDIYAPSGYLGSRMGFAQISQNTIPLRVSDETSYTSFVRKMSLNIDSDIQIFPSIGEATSRPFLGISSVSSRGNMEYVPIYKNGITERFDPSNSTFSPAGWSVDFQAMDYIINSTRHGGKLYIGGESQNFFLKLIKRYDNSTIIDAESITTPIGPISSSSWGIHTGEGQINSITVDFVTSPGIIS